MEENSQIIKTIGENGEEVLMELQEIVNVEGRDYALLSVVDENAPKKSDDDADELIIMRMNKSENECTFEIIEDDEEFDMVAQAITDGEAEE